MRERKFNSRYLLKKFEEKILANNFDDKRLLIFRREII